MRRCLLLAPFVLLAFPARAADAPAVVPLVFELRDNDWEDQRLIEAMREALSRTPGFNLMAKVTPDALVITISDGLGRDGHNDTTSFNFTAVFTRNGDKIGESIEGCTVSKLSDCADQFAADAASAAGLNK